MYTECKLKNKKRGRPRNEARVGDRVEQVNRILGAISGTMYSMN